MSLPLSSRGSPKAGEGRRVLLKYDELAPWARGCEHANSHIRTGYRCECTFGGCAASLFYKHNETGNCWTHLLGIPMFVFFAWHLKGVDLDLPAGDFRAFWPFFAGGITCMFCSTVFHIFNCHSERIAKIVYAMDYSGIIAMIYGSGYPLLHFYFQCVPRARTLYLIGITVFCILVLPIVWFDKVKGPEYRGFRAVLFASLALYGLMPLAHLLSLYSIEGPFVKSLGLFIAMALCYVFGAILFASRAPEACAPGKFDIWFHSHQIFHVMVLAGAALHYLHFVHIVRSRHHIARLCDQTGK